MKRRLQLIIVLFLISFTGMVVLAFYAIRRFTTLNNYTRMVEHTYYVLSKLDNLESTLKDVDRLERGYLLTRDSQYLNQLMPEANKLFPLTDTLKSLAADNPEAVQDIIWVRSYIVNRLDGLKADIKYMDTSKTPRLPAYFHEGNDAAEQCAQYIQRLRDRERNVLENRVQGRKEFQQITYSGIRDIFLVFGFITLFLFAMMMREINKRFRYQSELQARLIDLQRSHSELEQIAFAASHHLQEPLRKIQVFINKILYKNKADDDDTKTALERINASAIRMQELVEDLADLTNLVKEHGEKKDVQLNKLIDSVLEELRPKIEKKNPDIRVESLSTIHAYPEQVHLLFKALLDNAIKFSREDERPYIRVSGMQVGGVELAEINKNLVDKNFYRISVSDNGIGFDNKFMHKMFFLFQRLHNQQSTYEGKGTGLAICQRVMANHHGFIIAHGHPNSGATFKLYFPL